MLAIFEQNEFGFRQWYDRDVKIDVDNPILTKDFLEKRIPWKIQLEAENYEELGIEYNEDIIDDKQYIREIIKSEKNYADDTLTWDFYEEVRSNLVSYFKYTDSRWIGFCVGCFLMGLFWIIAIPSGWV